MKFFTARTLPIFEQCFGQNKEFFNSLLGVNCRVIGKSPGQFPAAMQPAEPLLGMSAHQVFDKAVILKGICDDVLLRIACFYKGKLLPQYHAVTPEARLFDRIGRHNGAARF